jgi:hypothetical protein
MDTSFELTINNRKVFDFYKNGNLNFEYMNILFIDILEKLTSEIGSSLNTNLATKLLEKYTLLDNKIDNLGFSVNKFQDDISSLLTVKLSEYRKEYMSDLKLILLSNNVDYILPLIKETNSNLLDKTTILLNEILPKTQDCLTKDICSHLTQFQSTITNETTKLLSSTLDKNTIDAFLKNMNLSFGQSQQTLTTIISSSETRIETRLGETDRKMNEIKEISSLNQSSQQVLQSNVSEILKKFEKGSSKGNISEHITYNILLSLFPCATIDYVGDQKETGDIILIRNNKPKILIENKDHESKNVTKPEVDKFIRDCEIQNCCGIMFAQHRGVCNKENFELQVHNGNVLLYVHELNFDKDKIKIAIEVVEHFKIKLDEHTSKDNDHTIEPHILEEINKEYTFFTTNRITMTKILKDFNEKMNNSINDIRLPSLEKYLSSRFACSSIQNGNICKYCEIHIPKSVKQHQRHCPAKKAYETLHPDSDISDDETAIDTLRIVIPETNSVISGLIVKKDVKPKKK